MSDQGASATVLMSFSVFVGVTTQWSHLVRFPPIQEPEKLQEHFKTQQGLRPRLQSANKEQSCCFGFTWQELSINLSLSTVSGYFTGNCLKNCYGHTVVLLYWCCPFLHVFEIIIQAFIFSMPFLSLKAIELKG